MVGKVIQGNIITIFIVLVLILINDIISNGVKSGIKMIDESKYYDEAIAVQKYKICLQIYCIKSGNSIDFNAVDSAFYSENEELRPLMEIKK